MKKSLQICLAFIGALLKHMTHYTKRRNHYDGRDEDLEHITLSFANELFEVRKPHLIGLNIILMSSVTASLVGIFHPEAFISFSF